MSASPRAHRRRNTVVIIIATVITLLGLVPTANAGVALQTATNTPLTAGVRLTAGTYRTSANGFVRLTMNADGNLVVAAGGRTLWSTGTKGAGYYATVTATGSLSVNNSAGAAVWRVGSAGAGATLTVDNDGGLYLRNKIGALGWASGSRAYYLRAGMALRAGQRLTSPAGPTLEMGANGDLIAFGAYRRIFWSTGTFGHPGSYALVQPGGALVIVAPNGAILWSSRTTGATSMFIDPQGAIGINASARVVWSSGGSNSVMLPNLVLRANQRVTAPSGEFLVFGTNGNMAVWRGKTLLWQAGVQANAGGYALLEAGGTLSIRSSTGRVLWTSGTAFTGPNRLVGGAGGVFSLIGSSGVVWRTSTSRSPTPAEYATRLLARWPGRISGLPGVRSDLLAASRGRLIQNSDSCGNAVAVHPDILRVLNQLTDRYTLYLNNIITGHGCDSAQHPKGRAVDLNRTADPATGRSTNFASYRSGDNQSFDREVMSRIAALLPAGGGLGQYGCPGRMIAVPPRIQFFPDSCTHQHFNTVKG